jgi:hypothetical protein
VNTVWKLSLHCEGVLKIRENDESLDKLDRVGPVDNRPSPDKLYHFVKKKKKSDV